MINLVGFEAIIVAKLNYEYIYHKKAPMLPNTAESCTSHNPFPVIRQVPDWFINFTDGSDTAQTLNGGAGIVVAEEGPAKPITFLTKQ